MNPTERPYQVVLYCGPQAPELEDVTLIDVTPTEASAEAVIAALRASQLTPADLRSRTVFWAEGDRNRALATYAALCGFAARRLDVSGGADTLDAEAIDASARSFGDAGRPDVLPEHIQVGLVAHPELPTVLMAGKPSPGDISLVRYARRARFAPIGDDPVAAISLLLVVAGIRARGELDRMPLLCRGDESAPAADTPGEPVGLDLEALRREGTELRRSLRSDDRNATVDHLDLSERQRTLLAAAALPIEETLARLGSTADLDTGLWHCPRPDRHTHGDATASMRVVKAKAKCPRCDPERMDALRLVMDVKSCSADEAADWLLAARAT